MLSEEEDLGIYRYKGIVDIPPISFCDDVLSVSECGIKTVEVNSIVNVKIESKKLNLGKDKCKKLHIGKHREKKCETVDSLKVHNSAMHEADKIKYLGEIIDVTGNMNENINERIHRSIGLRSKLKSLISGISLGSFHFEICLAMRKAAYLN